LGGRAAQSARPSIIVCGNAPGRADNGGCRHGAAEAIESPAAMVTALHLPPRSEVGWRVVARTLVSSARGSEGVELYGVNWEREARLSAAVRDVRAGALRAVGTR